jgi:hypothetical protein
MAQASEKMALIWNSIHKRIMLVSGIEFSDPAEIDGEIYAKHKIKQWS